MLTAQEREAVRLAGELWNLLCNIVGGGPTREADLGELCVHVHAIQHTVMAQSAARQHPNEFRLLGEILPQQQGRSVEFRSDSRTVIDNWAAVRDALTAEIVQEFGLGQEPL